VHLHILSPVHVFSFAPSSIICILSLSLDEEKDALPDRDLNTARQPEYEIKQAAPEAPLTELLLVKDTDIP
jgi:hypothetical protein